MVPFAFSCAAGTKVATSRIDCPAGISIRYRGSFLYCFSVSEVKVAATDSLPVSESYFTFVTPSVSPILSPHEVRARRSAAIITRVKRIFFILNSFRGRFWLWVYLYKSFGRAFSKARAGGGRGALLAVATAKRSFRRFFLPSFFFAPLAAKEKAGGRVG